MSELKFSCPRCGQHIECSKAASGHIIHCPACCAELRIPFSAAPVNGEPPKAELIIHGSSNGTPAGAGTPGNAVSMNGKELHCRCPVCQSHLRIPASVAAQPDDVFPSAELVSKSPDAHPPKPAAPVGDGASATPLTEREQHIAAERAARTVSLYPQMKPRLDLLGAKSSVPPQDNPSPADEKVEDWMKKAANE